MAIITKNHHDLQYLAADGIPVPHGFTTRLGGVSKGSLSSLNLGFHRGDDPANIQENYRRLGQAIGFDPARLVLTHQTHSDLVQAVTDRDCRGLDHRDYPECDALITNTPGVALGIFTADCTPILLYDPVTGAVGAAHAGWRGTAAAIAAKTVEAMALHYGSRPADICAAIGPNIGPCCFQTDGDVPDAMVASFGPEAREWIRPADEKYYVNLKALNALALRRVGVENIEISDACTACQHDIFWSHRVTRGDRGSQGAIILCKEGRV